jgi:hypothetical protein
LLWYCCYMLLDYILTIILIILGLLGVLGLIGLPLGIVFVIIGLVKHNKKLTTLGIVGVLILPIAGVLFYLFASISCSVVLSIC